MVANNAGEEKIETNTNGKRDVHIVMEIFSQNWEFVVVLFWFETELSLLEATFFYQIFTENAKGFPIQSLK